ncbi:unnamed protein product, partial [Closterium sp. NIES-54]
GPAPSGVSQVDPLPGPATVQVTVDSSAARGAAYGGAASGSAEAGGVEFKGVAAGGGEPRGAEPEGVEPEGAASEGAESGARGAGAAGAGGFGVAAGAGVIGGTATTCPGGARTRGTGAAGTGGVEGAGARDLTESGTTGVGGARAGGAGVGGPGAGGAGVGGPGVGGAGAGGAGVVDSGGTVRPRPYFVPLLQQSGGLTERRDPASRPVSPVRTARRVPRLHPPPVSRTHAMTLCPSSVPLRVPLPGPPESSLPKVPDPESDRARAVSPTVSRLLANAVTDPSFESAAASILVAELLDFAAAFRLDHATALVAQSASPSPPSDGGECALGTDVLEDRQEDLKCLAAAVPRFASMVLAPEGDPDAPDIPTPRSYAEAITGTQWSLRRPVYGLRQVPREWHDTLRTTLAALGFAPATADPLLFLRTDTSLPPFYILVYADDLVFATGQSSAHHYLDSVTHGAPGLSALRLPVLLATAHSSVYQPLALSSTFGRVRRAEWFVQRACGLPHGTALFVQYVGHGARAGGQGPVVLTGHADALIALCQEHRLEHRTKHIALRYFLARELQQRGQLRLAYVATRANTADVFTKPLPPGGGRDDGGGGTKNGRHCTVPPAPVPPAPAPPAPAPPAPGSLAPAPPAPGTLALAPPAPGFPAPMPSALATPAPASPAPGAPAPVPPAPGSPTPVPPTPPAPASPVPQGLVAPAPPAPLPPAAGLPALRSLAPAHPAPAPLPPVPPAPQSIGPVPPAPGSLAPAPPTPPAPAALVPLVRVPPGPAAPAPPVPPAPAVTPASPGLVAPAPPAPVPPAAGPPAPAAPLLRRVC